MATKIATHSSNDWDLTTNWSGGTPVDTDDVIVGAGCGFDQTDVTSNAALTAVEARVLHIRPDCIVNLGASGAPITMAANRLLYEGGYNPATGTAKEFWFAEGTPDVTELVQIEASHRDAIIHINGGTITETAVTRGQVSIDSGATLTRLSIGYKDSPSTDARVILAAGSTVGNVYQGAGKLASQIAVTEARINNGEWIQDSAAITTAIVGPGGRLTYKHSTVTTIYLLPGSILDITQYTGIIACTNLIKHRGSRIIGDWQNTSVFTYVAASSIIME